MKRLALFVVAMIMVMVPVTMASTQQRLEVRASTGDLVTCLDVQPEDIVQLQFTHSMYGGYVRESWLVTPDGQLNRHRFVTENAAAAEYYASDGSSYRAEDGFVVPGEPLQQPELVVRVNNRGNHQLSLNGNSISLAGQVDASTQVRIFLSSGACEEIVGEKSGKDR